MTSVCRSVLPRILLAIALLAFLSFPPPIAAQPVDRPCAEESAPADGFRSAGIGLTIEELTALYGEPEIGQGPFNFAFEGFRLHKSGCDLILSFPPDTSHLAVDETALVAALLPEDAELVGTFALGSIIYRYEENTLWRSPSLAARFSALGEDRGELILVTYTYEPLRPAIEQIDLVTVALPE